jgi:hypothetical protein
MRADQWRWRDASGAWGPAAFVVATAAAGRRQPGYWHRRDHISGLAAKNTRSAAIMIPGFVALGLASLTMPSNHRSERALLRASGVGTILAGLFRCSDVRCPDPTRDADATASDAAHQIASVLTFIAWTVLPFVDAKHRRSPKARAIVYALGLVTTASFVAAGLTAQSDHPSKGLAQRLFLGSVFAWYLTNAVRSAQRAE